MTGYARYYLNAKICNKYDMPFSTYKMIYSFLLWLHYTYAKIHIYTTIADTGVSPQNKKAHLPNYKNCLSLKIWDKTFSFN